MDFNSLVGFWDMLGRPDGVQASWGWPLGRSSNVALALLPLFVLSAVTSRHIHCRDKTTSTVGNRKCT